MDFLQQLNEWGQNGILRYGLVDTILSIVLIVLLSVLISKYLTHLIRRLKPRNQPILLKIKKVVVCVIALYAILTLFVPAQAILNPLLASGGIVAVVLGLAAQETVGNLISGMMILLFRPFHINDLVRVNNGEYVGTVVEITIRHTVIQTFENTRIIIPNAQMNTAVLENISDIHSAKADFLYVTIAYDSDLDKAIALIEQEVARHPKYCDPRSPQEKEEGVPEVIVRVTDFKDSGIELRATVYSNDNSTCFIMLSDLRIAIKQRFDEEGIEMPYPKRDVYIRKIQKKEELH